MLKIIVFIFGSAGFSWLRGLFPLVVVSGGRSLVVLRLPTAMASLVSERRLQGAQASVAAARGLSNFRLQAPEHRLSCCGTWAWLFHGMCDLHSTEPMSSVLAGGFFTTEPSGKPLKFLICLFNLWMRSLRGLVPHCSPAPRMVPIPGGTILNKHSQND